MNGLQLSNEQLNRIETAKKFLWDKLESFERYKENRADLEYRYEHSLRVAHIGSEIALAEGLDVERTTIACLLHDVGYCLNFDDIGGWQNHGRASAQIARPFLLGLGFTIYEVEEMCYGIATHVDGVADFAGTNTALSRTVGEADNIDRYDAYRIYESLQYKKFSSKSLNEKIVYAESNIKTLEELKKSDVATETSRRMWIERLDFQLVYFKRLLNQLKRSI